MEPTSILEKSPLCGQCVWSQVRIGHLCLSDEHYLYLGCEASISGCAVLNDHFDRDTPEYKQNCEADSCMYKDTWMVRPADATEVCRGCMWVEECGCNFDNCIFTEIERNLHMANERMKLKCDDDGEWEEGY